MITEKAGGQSYGEGLDGFTAETAAAGRDYGDESKNTAVWPRFKRAHVLQKERRVEFGAGILPKMIEAFCDSDFIDQSNFVDTLIRLQDIFYEYKNEMQDELTDDELLHFMREQFDEICFGDLNYLEGTCLRIFAEAVRAGYRGYQASEGCGEYGRFDEVQRWDRELYLEALEALF